MVSAVPVEEQPEQTIELAAIEIPKEVISLVPRALAHELWAIPVHRTRRALVVALADPSDRSALDELHLATGLHVLAVRAASRAISAALWKYYRGLA